VNGQIVQHGNSRDMIFGIPEIIEFLSDFMTLAPGDLILTGTPKGIAYLKAGDEVTTEIESIGRLTNTIIRQPARQAIELSAIADASL
jgi:5-oxopent-3-ene-1,2,5-tricarboxylate decarboxylase / 2-hydroxyhepta-2,4-diene-1,7-dioate isomerase